MEMRRTVPVALNVDSDAAALLEDTVDTFLWSAQYVTDHAFDGDYVTTSQTQLDEETYDDVREQTGGFNAGLVQAARNKAAEAAKSVVARWKNGKKASKTLDSAEEYGCDHIFLAGRKRLPTGKAIFGDATQKVILSYDDPVTVLTV